MSFKDDIKPYFETGDYPTQAQFYAMFDKLRWKDEALSIADITTLQTILNSLATPVDAFTVTGTHAYIIPAGFNLESIILKPVADCDVRIDTSGTVLPGDVMMEQPVAAAGLISVVNKMAFDATTVIVYGLPSGSRIYFLKRKIV